MAKSRLQKDDLLSGYKEILENGGGYILVDTNNLDTASVTTLKKKLKEAGSTYSVVKNSIFKIALQDSKQPVQAQDFDGPTAIITYSDDPTAPAKLLKEVRNSIKSESPLLQLKYATLNGEYIDAQRAAQLAEVPSREELLAKLLGSLNAPISGVMNALTGNARGFTMILKQLSEKEA